MIVVFGDLEFGEVGKCVLERHPYTSGIGRIGALFRGPNGGVLGFSPRRSSFFGSVWDYGGFFSTGVYVLVVELGGIG